jgi:hypothetical protein
MSALGTHEITAGIGLGLEPPLSPPVVRGPSASVPMPAQPANDNISDLPSPPPAIRPPESAPAAPAPAPQAEVPHQPEQAPVPAQPEPVLPAALPEPELPAMAPAEAPVVDYFAQQEPTDETLPEIAPVEATPVEPAALPEIAPIPLVAPAAPVEEPAAELPTMAPPEPEMEPEMEPEIAPEIAPVAFFAPQPVEVAPEPEAEAEVAPEPLAAPEPLVAPEPELQLPDDPFEAAMPAPEPVASPEIEELFAAQRSGQFRVVVRLKEGDGVEVGEFRDFGTAMEGAQEVIEQFSTATEGQWPFYAGRFIRPDLIVSVDVVEGEQAE